MRRVWATFVVAVLSALAFSSANSKPAPRVFPSVEKHAAVLLAGIPSPNAQNGFAVAHVLDAHARKRFDLPMTFEPNGMALVLEKTGMKVTFAGAANAKAQITIGIEDRVARKRATFDWHGDEKLPGETEY